MVVEAEEVVAEEEVVEVVASKRPWPPQSRPSIIC